MSEFTKKLVKLLESECSIEVIKKKMNLSDSQLAYRLFMLKYQGYTICNKYYGNGDITASFGVDRDDYAKIYTKYNEKTNDNEIYLNGLLICKETHKCLLYDEDIELTPEFLIIVSRMELILYLYVGI